MWLGKRNLDIVLLFAIIILNAAFNLLFILGIQKEVRLSRMSSIYEKVKICLTSTSILLAAAGLIISGMAGKDQLKTIQQEMVRAFTWFIVAILSGVVNIAIMPVRLDPDQYLKIQHAAFWLWLFATGPVMYVSLILGTLWFLVIIRRLVLSGA